MLKVIIGLFGLGIIVFIHELGHFIAAHITGVTVETFSIGWGPVLWRKKKGDTEYRLSLIPMGGYCGMKGEKDLQLALSEKLNEVPKEEGSFYAASPLHRMFIAFSGPCMNLLSAVLAFTVIWMVGYTYTSAPNRIIITSQEQPAYISGVRTGDVIISVDGKATPNFSDVAREIGIRANETIMLEIERAGSLLSIPVTPELNTQSGSGLIGITSWIPMRIAHVDSDSLFAQAGIQDGDTIIAVNGKPIANTYEFQEILDTHPQRITVSYERSSKTDTKPIIETADVVLQYGVEGTVQLGVQIAFESLDRKSVV